MRRLILLATAAVALLVGGILPAQADPNPTEVPLHEHVLTTPAGSHVIAQGLCNAEAHGGFLQFHHNVHRGTPGTEAFTNPNNPVSISAQACP